MYLQENKETLYQWEINQKVIVENELVKEVHFSNATTPKALVVEVVDGMAEVPNILLQDAFDIKAFGYCGQSVRECFVINVVGRAKPADYVYTETEIKEWETLEASVEELHEAVNEATKLIEDKPGATPGKGEIFNDYESNIASNAYTHAEGMNTTAGGKAFKIISAPSGTVGGTGTYFLDSTEGIEIGMTYSAITSKAAHNQGKITLINRNTNKVQVSNYADYALNTEPDTEHQIHNYFMIDGKPELGTVEVGATAHAEGVDTMAANYGAHAEGRNTLALGKYGHAEGKYTVAGHAAHAEGSYTKATGDASHSEGESTKAIGNYSHAEGYETQGTGLYAHAEGFNAVASGAASHAEGYNYKGYTLNASGKGSHAEGISTQSTAEGSHAEGYMTKATANGAHSEGMGSHAEGVASHAEGENTKASGKDSHAEGIGTKAVKDYQHVQGKFNLEDTTTNGYAHIVGNGNSNSNRSNAHTLDWNGNAWFAGYGEFDYIILKSSTAGSTKRFKITVNDSGTISAVRI